MRRMSSANVRLMTVYFGISNRIFKYSQTIGRVGPGGTSFRNPHDVSFGKDGTVYVLNRSYEEVEGYRGGVRVTMITIDEEYIGEFGAWGKGDGELMRPTAIAMDREDNLYITDEWLQRVNIFDKTGKFLHCWGQPGSEDGQMERPGGLAFDKEENLYVADSANNRVQVFTKEGKFLDKFGGPGNGVGQVNLPWGLAIDGKGDVFVADWRNDRIQKFAPDGRFMAKFGVSGNLPGQFNRPAGVTVDQDGDIYVADWQNHRVQVFTPEFRHITTFTGDATISKWARQTISASPDIARMVDMVRDMRPWQQLLYPVSVRVDQQRRVFIVDCGRHRLQIYQKEN